MNCLVCYDDESLISCINCNSHICQDCLTIQLNIAQKEIKVPRCSYCGYKFYYSFINKLDKDIKLLYLDIMGRYLNKKFENEFELVIIKKKLIEQIIQKRREHFDKFPLGIKAIIQTALMHKIKKVDKGNAETIETIVNTSSKNCLNPICAGKLKLDKCLLCDVTFCLNCEKPKGYRHQCNKADVESLNLIKKESVKCPQCRVPIHKSEGCNEMRCTVCSYNFNYRDPTLVSHGNDHNTVFKYKGVKNLFDIRNRFNDEERELLTNIINMKASKYELFPVVQSKSKPTMAKAYETKHNHKKYIIKYNKIEIKIHEKYEKNKLDLNLLQYYIDILTHNIRVLKINI